MKRFYVQYPDEVGEGPELQPSGAEEQGRDCRRYQHIQAVGQECPDLTNEGYLVEERVFFLYLLLRPVAQGVLWTSGCRLCPSYWLVQLPRA